MQNNHEITKVRISKEKNSMNFSITKNKVLSCKFKKCEAYPVKLGFKIKKYNFKGNGDLNIWKNAYFLEE